MLISEVNCHCNGNARWHVFACCERVVWDKHLTVTPTARVLPVCLTPMAVMAIASVRWHQLNTCCDAWSVPPV